MHSKGVPQVSHSTRQRRREILAGLLIRLCALGYYPPTVDDLRAKHIRALVRDAEQRRVSSSTWETYVEDRVLEGVKQRVSADATQAERFMLAKLDEELKRFNTPATDKTRKLFVDYLETDVTTAWHWNGVDVAKAKEKLDALVKKRGDAVHRSKVTVSGASAPHLVSKEDIEKAIRFLKELVASTEKALDDVG
jgi:hypothetical protein